ncbi:putative hydrolase of the HAD superfamily [Chitinivorax tropicus]|uniref:Putative hydrolase of the HAD superfamily n=1 Tax=Chitinivorax tropicus TaxID=714531 RepID=A0A840MP93_9PROT|nr:pyrimidine 5'-nucleotidase [Chitinivorax tropicus]MBB5020260.1 putative hydrolase of the HAD superfamily [Chitinivorax tropicus]
MSVSPVWIFDLDNTLHHADAQVFPAINQAMTHYMMQTLALDEAEANHLRQHYWHRYGATLHGLIRHHQISPDHFLLHTHRFDSLPDMLHWDPALKTVLAALPGRKLLFTNGPFAYAQAVLAELGIARFFCDVIATEHVGYRAKPDPAAFRAALQRHRLPARRCIMVEDSLPNLRTAKRLGMHTVWLSPQARRPAVVDWRIDSLIDLLRLPVVSRCK